MKFITSIFLLFIFLTACNQTSPPPPPVKPADLPAISTKTENNNQPIGSMTNQRPEDMESVSVENPNLVSPKELLENIQLAIISSYQNWVIFKNGTYIIFDNIDTIPDVQKAAIELLNKYKPQTPEDNNWNFTITDLDQTEGWAVYGNGYGIYSFIHSKELSMNPSPQQIGAYAKAKRALDEKNPQIIYISSAKGISPL